MGVLVRTLRESIRLPGWTAIAVMLRNRGSCESFSSHHLTSLEAEAVVYLLQIPVQGMHPGDHREFRIGISLEPMPKIIKRLVWTWLY